MNPEENFDFHDFLGNRVRERGISLEKLSKASGISVKNLRALMHEDLEHLPAAPYLHGYVVKLGQILDFDGEFWWQNLKKESSIKRSGAKDELPKNRFAKQAIKKIWIIGALVALLILVVIMRLPYIIGKPLLTITNPRSETSDVALSEFTVSGILKNGDSLSINSSSVSINDDGTFEKTIELQPGLNTIEISAKKTLGQETTVLRQVLYKAPDLSPASGTIPDTISSSTPL